MKRVGTGKRGSHKRSVKAASPHIEELEPRLLFSADAAGLFAHDLFDSHHGATEITVDDQLEPIKPTTKQSEHSEQRTELVFVDTDTPNYQQLVDGILAEGNESRRIEVILLDNERNGIDQITETLGSYQGVDALHLISHGSESSVDLGNFRLDGNTLDGHKQSLESWVGSLDADADILIYGCNLAASSDGQHLVDQLARLTGADIAASDDLTGSAQLGGDWELEHRTGEIEANVVIGIAQQQSWQGVLVDVTVESHDPGFAALADTAYEVASTKPWGQTFSYDSPGATYSANKIELVLYKVVDTPAGQNITVSVRDGWSGTVLGSANISSDSLANSEAWVSLDIGSLTLNDNTTYTIQIESDGTEKVYLGVDNAGGYANGNFINNSGAGEPGKDAAFKLILSQNAPVLAGANNLTTIDEDPVSNPGTLVSDLISGQITDADAGALEGIAVVAVDDTNGTWEYTTNGGANWFAFGAVDSSSARLLGDDADTRVRFVPDANWNGAVTNGITFHAWDQTSGSSGGTGDLTSTFTVRDEFATAAYNNDDGSTGWSGDWQESGESNGPSSGLLRVTGGEMRIGGAQEDTGGGSLTREVDLSGAVSATLTYDYRAQNIDNTGPITVEIGYGGGNWRTLATYSPNAGTGSESFDITGEIAADTQIRVSHPDKIEMYLFVDDVQIEAVGAGGVGGATAFSTASASSSVTVNAVNDAPTGSVTISGTPTEDSTLTASNTLADEDGLGAISYQWQRNGSDITGETGSTYTLTQADVGNTITVVASYTDGESTAEQVASAGVGPINNLNDAPTGSVTISGTPTEDSTLTAANTLADEDGMGAVSYQWQRNGSDITGETGGTYTLTQADVGNTITVVASYTDGESTAEQVTSAGVGPINNLNDAPTGSVTISGTPTEDSTLTAANTLADEDGMGAVSYQWQRNGSDITGETGGTYTLTQADVGTTITVVASYTDGESTAEQVTSAGVGPINNLNDAPTGSVTISGTPTEDSILTAANTLADEDGMGAVSYQWQRNGSDITGETGNTYTLAQADVGTTITVVASYTDGQSTAEQVSSAGVGPVANLNEAPVLNGWYNADWDSRKPVTIDSTQVEADLTDFPVLITIVADAELAAAALANGDDILFTAADSVTKLSHEIQSYNAGTGALTVWVKTDLSASEDTELFMYFGNSASGNQENINDVWSANYVGVWHLEDAPTGVAGDVADSTAFANDGNTVGGMDAADLVAGQIGNALDFDEINDLIRIPDSASLDGLNDEATFEMWVWWDDASDGDAQFLMSSSNRFSDGDGFEWASQDDGDHFFYPDAMTPDTNYNLGLNPFTDQTWQHVAATMNFATKEAIVYVDGTPMSFSYEGVSGSWTSLSDADDLLFGGNPDRATRFFDGLMDEIRVSDVARSQDWIQTSVNNQKTPATFFSVGASENRDLTLTPINENTVSPAGDTVAAILASGGGDRITDEDIGAVEGIAVVGVDDTNGEWQYDANADGTWVAFGTVSDASAVLLDTDALIRFVPDADYNGSAGDITFRGWDQTSGSNGQASVNVSANGGSTAYSTLTAVASLTVDPVNSAPTGTVSISGTPTEDSTLTASNTLADADGLGAISYQWQRNGSDITGETGSTYTLAQADVGATITVDALYLDGGGTNERVSSAGVGPINNLNDAPTGAVSISGTPTEDSILTASNTLADEDGLGAISYQWQRDGSDITGETGSTYTLAQADVGTTITVVASYTDGQSNPEQVTSAGVGPINNLNDAPTGSVTISGTPTEDSTLTAANTLADEDGFGAVSYQWQRNGSDIAGETGSTYTLAQADVGTTITVVASYTDGESTAEQVTSAGVGPINNLNDAPTGLVTISGTPTEDSTLTAANTLADEDGMGVVSYQWQRNGSDITGETGGTYTLTQADVGNTITVVASYTDGESTAEQVTSAGVGPINNLNDAPTGSVTISGTPTEDSTLTAANTLADEDGMGAVSYQWQRNGSDITGETGGTYTLTQADVGNTITVVASYTDGESTAEQVTSAGVGPINNLNDAPTGAVSISGTPTEDSILTASNTLADEDGLGAISYQWQRDGSDITGETGSTYTLAQADVGTTITVVASYTDGQSTTEQVASAGVGPINNLNDAPTGAVSISGTPTEDSTLTASNTLADEDGLGTISYQWQRNGSDITGETGSTYTLTQGDVGTTITVAASYTDSQSTAEQVTSAGVGPINNLNDAPTGSVTISGTPTEDSTLTAANTLADEDGMGAVSYQWQRNGSEITGETGGTYTLTQADVGNTITVVASYTDGESTAEQVTSAGVGPINNLNDAPTGSVTISGTPTEDSTLTAANTLADADGMGAVSYQWQRNGSDITGETGGTYTLTQADVGATITVVASYTDGQSNPEQVTSAGVGPINNLNDAPTGSVTISGTPTEDSTLTAANTLADEDGMGVVSYQWQRNGSDITGETGGTYTLTQADVGNTITVVASYTDGESTAEQMTSAGVGPINNLNDAPTGSVTISGTPTEDSTLTAANTLADEDGMGAVSYQWQRNGSDITGETGGTYALTQADVGATITVVASYTDGESTAEQVTSAGVGPINNLNDAPTGSVTISGTPTEDSTLTAANTLADEDGMGAVSYQWQRNGSDITGETGGTYTLTQADVGNTITVVASYTDGESTAEQVTSAGVGPINNLNDAPTGSVTISGTPTEDSTLTAANTLADEDGMGAVSYQWQRNGSDITGETGGTYTLTQADVGATITVVASYTDGQSNPEQVTSAGVGPINNLNDAPTGSVTISGTPTEDSTLTAANTLADEDGMGAVSYQWQRNGSDITGETGSTYTLTQADVGNTITVVASYTDGESTAEQLSSAGVGPINNLNDAPTGSVTISGTPTEDSTLTAGNTLADEDGMGAVSYQWQRNGSDITGETGGTYTLTQADVGATITVVASYTDGESTAEQVTSAGVGPINNLNDAPTGAVTISGTPTEDSTLTAANTLADADGMGAVSYQWQRNGSDITGETGGTYTLTQADVGATITVVASYTDGESTAEQVTSAGVGPINNLNDAPTGAVTISGTPTEDSMLTAANTLADEDGMGAVSYQWQRNGSDITGETGGTYTLTQADVGATITVVASYTDGQSNPEQVTSAGVGPISNLNDAPTGAVTISGTPTEDSTLTAANTLADEDGMGVVSYQWQRDGVDVTGATGETYRLGQDDVGAVISVTAGYIDGFGNPESSQSIATSPVQNVNDAPSGQPLIDVLDPQSGDTLTVSHNLNDEDGVGAISYQWQRDGADIAGATGSTYTASATDVGASISVVASYTDDFGTSEQVASIGTAAVADVPAPEPEPEPQPESEPEPQTGVLDIPLSALSVDANGQVGEAPDSAQETRNEMGAPITESDAEEAKEAEDILAAISGGASDDSGDSGSDVGFSNSSRSAAASAEQSSKTPSQLDTLLAATANEGEVVEALFEAATAYVADASVGADPLQLATQGIALNELIGESGEQFELAHVNSVLKSHAMWRAIDEMNEEIEGSGDSAAMSSEQLVVQVATSTGLGLVVGVSAYVLRGGALLASLLSVSPLWTVYDPIPLLTSGERDRPIRRFWNKVRRRKTHEAGRPDHVEDMFGT